MIQTIFFDIGGVLLNIHPDRTIQYLAEKTNQSKETITATFPTDDHHKYERGEISDNEFYLAVKMNLPPSVKLSSTDFWKAWSLLVGTETEVLPIMNNLANNYAVWLLSNTNPYHIITEERLKLFEKINGGIYSFEVGSRKPESEIYRQALKIANTKAENSLFIDDLAVNVEMAKSLNINAIQFKSIVELNKQLQYFGVL